MTFSATKTLMLLNFKNKTMRNKGQIHVLDGYKSGQKLSYNSYKSQSEAMQITNFNLVIVLLYYCWWLQSH